MWYVLPFGQMSLWGYPKLALNAYYLFYKGTWEVTYSIFPAFYFNYEECLVSTNQGLSLSDWQPSGLLSLINLSIKLQPGCTKNNLVLEKGSKINTIKKLNRIKASSRIGPHNKNIISIIFGSLLGDGYAEYRKNGTRIAFYQEGKHLSYILWLHKIISNLGYCNPILPKIQTRLGKKGIVRKIVRFKTWTYSSLNWIWDLWYVNGIKTVPSNVGEYLDPLALAIWIMVDGSRAGSGLKLSTNSFSYSDCLLIVKVLYENFNLKASVQSSGATAANSLNSQYVIYIWKESMPLLCEIVEPYVHSSMKYKLGK